jgi:hypothetical protein
MSWPSGRQLGVEELFAGRRSELFQPGDLHRRERLVGDVGEGGAAPKLEGLAEVGSFADGPFEPMRVHEPGVQLEHVARRPCNEDVGADQPAKLGNQVLQRADRGLRGRLAPQLLHEAMGRHELADV